MLIKSPVGAAPSRIARRAEIEGPLDRRAPRALRDWDSEFVKLHMNKSDKIRIDRNGVAMKAAEIPGLDAGDFRLGQGHHRITVESIGQTL